MSPSLRFPLTIAAAALLVGLASTSVPAQTAPGTYGELDAGSHALVLTLAVKPDKVDEFGNLMKSRIQTSRADPAVVDFRFFATPDPLVFVGFESFRSEAAFQAFAKSPDAAAFLERLSTTLARPPEAKLLRPLP